MGARHPNPRRFKIHRTYSIRELAVLARAHPNTIRNWRREGLKPIDSCRPLLFHGGTIREFLEARRIRAKRPTGPGQMYCLPCRKPQKPAGNMADYTPETPTAGTLIGLCPDCERMMFRRVSAARLHEVAAGFDLCIARAESSLKEASYPFVNCSFQEERKGENRQQQE